MSSTKKSKIKKKKISNLNPDLREEIAGKSIETDSSYQSILHKQMIAVMRILLEFNSSKTFQGEGVSTCSLEQAGYAVEEELTLMYNRQRVTNSSIHLSPEEAMLNVYTHFSAKLIKDFENSTLYHPDRFKLNEIKESNIILKDELTRLQSQSSESSARKDQTIETLTSEKSVLEFKNSSLLTALELLQTELLKITRSLNNAHQENVRLCMQSYQYKAEVDRSSEIIAECVKSRVGFVPRRVLLQIRRIKSMKAPGSEKQGKIPDQEAINESFPSSSDEKFETETDTTTPNQEKILDVRYYS